MSEEELAEKLAEQLGPLGFLPRFCLDFWYCSMCDTWHADAVDFMD